MAYPEDFDDIPLDGPGDLLRHPKPVQVALCLHRLESEVNNGGFHQFFLNPSGQFLPQTLEALEAIGALKTRHLLLQAALVAFPDGYPPHGADVESALAGYDEVADRLQTLDAQFYEYHEPLGDMVNRYLDAGA